MLSLKAEVASLAVRQQSVKLSTEGRSHSEGSHPSVGRGQRIGNWAKRLPQLAAAGPQTGRAAPM